MTQKKEDKLKGYVQMKIPYGGYFINDSGTIYSKKRDITMVSKIYDRCYRISLSGEGKSKCFQIHELVGEYFLPPVKDCKNIVHKNFDSLDNHVSNLKWVNDEDYGIYRQRKIQFDFLKENKGYFSIGDKFPSYCANKKGEIYGIAKKENVKVFEKYRLYYVMLFTFGHKYANYQLDLMMAETFLPKVEGKSKVLHKNFDMADCSVNNLKWCSDEEYKEFYKEVVKKENEKSDKLKGFISFDEPYEYYYFNGAGKVYNKKREEFMALTKKDRYNSVNLAYDNKDKCFWIHKTVAEYFLPKPDDPEKTEVWHKNGDTFDNNYTNLKWVTPQKLRELRKSKTTDEYLQKDEYSDTVRLKSPYDNYCVNKKAQVFSFNRNKPLLLSPDEKDDMYYAVLFYDDCKEKKFYAVDKMVAEAFIDNPLNLSKVIHKNYDLKDNNIENLEWSTEKNWQKFRLTIVEKNRANGHEKKRIHKGYQKKEKVPKICDLEGFVNMESPYDCYYINGKGEIYSLHKGQIIRSYMHQNGYCLYISLACDANDTTHTFSVSLLVAKYFNLPKMEGKSLLWHKDGNYSNNHIDNLQWVDKDELKKYRVIELKKTILTGELKDFEEIPGHDGMYYINKQGKIYSFFVYDYRTLILTSFGYYISIIGNAENKKHWFVHRLVATIFIPRVEGKYWVNHKDGNKTNNDVSNLEWCTPQENAQHAHDTGLHPKTKPEYDYYYYQIDEDDEIVTTYVSIAEIVKKFNNGVYDKELREELREENGNKIYGYYWKRERINYDIYCDELWRATKTGTLIDEYVEVSDYGRVRNSKTKHYYMLQDSGKYNVVSINDGENKKTYKVHQLVNDSFGENKYGTKIGIDVDHIDKNSKNNHASNLQCLDKKAHARKDKGISITEVCEDGTIKKYETMTDAGQAIGKNPGSISEAVKTGKPYMKSKWHKTSEYIE